LVETKGPCLDVDPDSDSELEKEKWIIEIEPIVTITTKKSQLEKIEDIEEGKHLFHS
jgi:hypothetical protein